MAMIIRGVVTAAKFFPVEVRAGWALCPAAVGSLLRSFEAFPLAPSLSEKTQRCFPNSL
jgi:hypothetical protein